MKTSAELRTRRVPSFFRFRAEGAQGAKVAITVASKDTKKIVLVAREDRCGARTPGYRDHGPARLAVAVGAMSPHCTTVYCTNKELKRSFLKQRGIHVDIWIDDQPTSI